MSQQAHPTDTAEQEETDNMAVFADNPQDPVSNLTLLKRVDVPRFSSRDADGRRLTPGERYELAVHFAVTAEDSAFPYPGMHPDQQDYAMLDGQELMVMFDLDSPMAFAPFKESPGFDYWNPNE